MGLLGVLVLLFLLALIWCWCVCVLLLLSGWPLPVFVSVLLFCTRIGMGC